MDHIDTLNIKYKKIVQNLIIPKAIHLIGHDLRKFYPHKNNRELYKHIQFKSNPNLNFPKSEITNIFFKEKDHQTYVELEINFLSLCGSATPLPIHYSEKIKEDFNDEKVLYDFLMLFNHHLQKFIYPIWREKRYYIEYRKDLKDKFSKQLLSILGLYPQSQQNEHSLSFHKLLPFLGILNMKPKSSETLASIIRYYINHNEVKIDECILSHAKIPEWQKNILAKENNILGKNFIIGNFNIVKHLKFRLHLNNIPWEYLYDYSSLGKLSEELKALISFTLNEPLDYDLSLNIHPKNIKELQMNPSSDILLGINSWIGIPNSTQNIIIKI